MSGILIPTGKCIDGGDGFNPDGFPVFELSGDVHFAIRIGYAYHYGYDPGGLTVGITCGNKTCVNPKHMVLCDAKGENIRQPEYHPEYHPERN